MPEINTGPYFIPESCGFKPQPAITLILEHTEHARKLGSALAAILQGGDFLGLAGNLGSGKTTLIQGLVGAVSDDEVTSPTYTLIQLYKTARFEVAHVDLYRLEHAEDLESVGYWDYAEDDRVLLCVEWFTHIEQAWPGDGFVVELSVISEGIHEAKLWGDKTRLEIVARQFAQ